MRRVWRCGALLGLLVVGTRAAAQSPEDGTSVMEQWSEAVGVYTMVRCERQPESALPKPSKPNEPVMFSGPPEALYKSPGRYAFHRVRRLEGQPPHDLTLEFLPCDVAWGEPGPMVGRTYLIGLRRDDSGKWACATPRACLYPAGGEKLTCRSLGVSLHAQVLRELVSAMDTPDRRYAALLLMKDDGGAALAKELARFAGLSGPQEGDIVLTILARAGRREAMPLAATLAQRVDERGSGAARCLREIADIDDPGVPPILKRFAFARHIGVRQFAVEGMNRRNDHTFAPYLVLTVLSERESDYTSRLAASALGFLFEELRPAGPFSTPTPAAVRAWWVRRMRGDALKDSERQTPASLRAQPTSIAELNERLFTPYPAVRRVAMAALAARADESSYPALMLALEDPEDDVALAAAGTLARLTHTPLPETTPAAFHADRTPTTAPLRNWWADWLNIGVETRPFHIPAHS